jgi:hypothetical protein
LPEMHSNSRRGQHTQLGTAHIGNQISDRNGGGGVHADGISSQRMAQPTPLFERLVTEEVQELKAYGRIIENQNRRLGELERIHGDLEARLELESRGRVQLETTLEEQEREWAIKFKELEADRDHWKEIVRVEQTKNARLIDQVVRKDQDIHRMLQRKVSAVIRISIFVHYVFQAFPKLMQTCRDKSMTTKGILLLDIRFGTCDQ